MPPSWDGWQKLAPAVADIKMHRHTMIPNKRLIMRTPLLIIFLIRRKCKDKCLRIVTKQNPILFNARNCISAYRIAYRNDLIIDICIPLFSAEKDIPLNCKSTSVSDGPIIALNGSLPQSASNFFPVRSIFYWRDVWPVYSLVLGLWQCLPSRMVAFETF